MARALELAWQGWGRVHPNPLVGAVVLQQGEVVGEGWHAEFGERHAEPAALAAAGARARGATVVCTLEPCDHQGKQPPCTDALIAAGVRRVVAAVADPNPVAAGGAARLRAAGRRGGAGPARRRRPRRRTPCSSSGSATRSRPFVALKLATSIDGRIADANGHSRWLSGEPAREFVHWLRAGFDALAVGGVTARADDPSLTVRGPLQPRRPPRRVVFAADGDVPDSLTLVRTARETADPWSWPPSAPAARVAPLEAAGVAVDPGQHRWPRRMRSTSRRRHRIPAGRGRRHGSPARSWPRAWWIAIYWVQTPALARRSRGDRRSPAFRRTALGDARALAGDGAPRAGRRHLAGAGPTLMFTGIVTAVGRVSATHAARPTGSS